MEDELLGEATVNITDTLKSGDFDGASHSLYPGCCRLNTQDRLGAIGPSASSLPHRRSSKGEDTPLPPRPPDAAPPKEEFVSSILRPGGPSCMGVFGTPSPPIANSTKGRTYSPAGEAWEMSAEPPRPEKKESLDI
jgi:hypothetical protein